MEGQTPAGGVPHSKLFNINKQTKNQGKMKLKSNIYSIVPYIASTFSKLLDFLTVMIQHFCVLTSYLQQRSAPNGARDVIWHWCAHRDWSTRTGSLDSAKEISPEVGGVDSPYVKLCDVYVRFGRPHCYFTATLIILCSINSPNETAVATNGMFCGRNYPQQTLMSPSRIQRGRNQQDTITGKGPSLTGQASTLPDIP